LHIHTFATVVLLLGFGAALAAQTSDRARLESAAKRANERMIALQREADALAGQQRSLLVDLRRLEIERDLKAEELRHVEADAQRVALELGNIGNQIDSLEAQAEATRPVLEARLAELYKLGSAGYVRLLFNVSDLKEVGRAYRMVAATAALDRRRAEEHRQNVERLRTAQRSLEQRRAEMVKLQQAAQGARAGAERAAVARAQLIAQIDKRRDLTAELSSELQSAQIKLQQTLTAIQTGTPRASSTAPALPIRPFRGDLDWPVAGRMLTPFGRRATSVMNMPTQSGIQFAAAEGSTVHVVHDGTIAYVGPFSGFGNLVIVDHGTQIFSLYGQLSSTRVERGGAVERADVIGTAGRILAGIPGVYFEMRVDGKPVDPLEWLRKQP
jgi:septal ring factor EnvC (AmiA/AmiB activator)